MRVVDQRLRGSRAVGGWVAVEERYFNRISLRLFSEVENSFPRSTYSLPLNFLLRPAHGPRIIAIAERLKRAASSAARREDEEEEGRIEKVLVSEATQRD